MTIKLRILGEQGIDQKMNESIKFLHAADLHLDSPFKGLANIPDEIFQLIRNSTFQAFERLIDVAIEHQVDFVLIVGDLFDHERQSLKAQLHLRDGFERLRKEQIHVYMSYGNHDFLTGNPYPIEFPDNVHTFPDETISSFTFEKVNKKLANIYGFSYEKRDVKENKAKQFKISDPSIPFHIAMLHGMVYGATDHDPYAPFRLEDLEREPFDYWALGHIHERQILQTDPPVVYPGNIQGRHRKETGEKGCYIVQMDEIETKLQFVPLQAITIVHETIDLRNFSTIIEIKDALVQLLEKNTSKSHLYAFDFYCHKEQNERLGIKERIKELVDHVNEMFMNVHSWQFIYTYDLHIEKENKSHGNMPFVEVIQESIDAIDIMEELKDLYNHTKVRSYLQAYSEDKMLQKAFELLIDELHKKAR